MNRIVCGMVTEVMGLIAALKGISYMCCYFHRHAWLTAKALEDPKLLNPCQEVIEQKMFIDRVLL